MNSSKDTDNPEPIPPGPGNTSTNSSRSGDDSDKSTKYKSIDKASNDELAKQKSEPEDPGADSDGAEAKYKSIGTLEKNSNMRVCQYLTGNDSKMTPVIFATDTYQQRKRVQRKGQIYKVQAFRFLEIGIRRILFHIGKTVEDYGSLFIMIPVALCAITLAIFIFCNKDLAVKVPFGSFINSPDPTMTAHKSTVGLRSMINLATNFNSSNPMFDAIRRSSKAEFSFIISPRSNYDSVLDKSILSLYSAAVEQAKLFVPETSKWTTICRENCLNSDLGARLLHDRQLDLKYPVSSLTPEGVSKYNETKYYLANLLGGIELDSDNVLIKAKSIVAKLKLKDNLNDRIFEQYELALRNMISNISASSIGNDVDISFWSARQYAADIINSLNAVHYQMIFSAVLLIVFCVLSCYKFNSYSSRPFFGLQMALIIILSVMTGYSIVSFSEFNAAAFPAVFIISAIGILFFYSYQTTWSRYSMTALHPIEKIAFIASWDGPCMVMGLIALILASVGTSLITQNGYVAYVLLVTGAGFTALLAFALLSMTVCLYKSGKREAEGVKWFHFCREGDKTFTNKFVPDFDEVTSGILHEKLTDLKPQWTRKIGACLANSNVRTVCLCIFMCYLFFCANGLFSYTIQLQEEDFVSSNSASSIFMKNHRKAFPSVDNYLEITFDEPLDYYDNQRRGEIFEMLKWALERHYAHKAISWLTDFDRFQLQEKYLDVNPETIVPLVSHVFLASDEYRKYASDIIIDKFQTQIVKSRMYLELTPEGIAKKRQLVTGLIAQARKVGLPMSIKAPFVHLLQHDIQVIPTMIIAYGAVTGIITLATFVLYSNPALAFYQFFGSFIANIAVVASAFYLKVELNIVTLTTALLGNFLITAIVILFAYSYCSAGPRQVTAALKIQYAFQCSLVPSVLACVSPVILFSPLLLLKIPILIHVFKMFVLIGASAMVTLLIFLPSLIIFFTHAINICCSSMNKICDETECPVPEQSAESIFFIPSTATTKAVGYGHAMSTHRMIMAPPSEVRATRTSRRSDRYAAASDYAENNCDTKSIDSRRERGRSAGSSSKHQTPRGGRRTINRRRGSDVTEEQIYEEPESPTPMTRPALPVREYHGSSHPVSIGGGYPSYLRNGLPRDEYFRYDRDMEMPSWRQFHHQSHQRYPHAPPPPMLPYPSPLRSRRFI